MLIWTVMETKRNSVYSISESMMSNWEQQFGRLKEKHKKYQQRKNFFPPRYKNKIKTMKEYASQTFQLGTVHVQKKGLTQPIDRNIQEIYLVWTIYKEITITQQLQWRYITTQSNLYCSKYNVTLTAHDYLHIYIQLLPLFCSFTCMA
jgi:hypothetical protein